MAKIKKQNKPKKEKKQKVVKTSEQEQPKENASTEKELPYGIPSEEDSTGTLLLSLKVGNDVYEARALTVVDALNSIVPGIMKQRGFFTLSKDGKKAELGMFPMHIKRLLYDKVQKQIFQKRITALLK